MDLSESTVVRQVPRVAARVVQGKAVVIVIDARTLHTLNDVGTRVWQLADGRSLGAIVEAITSEYAVAREQAARDVERFVLDLARVGAVTLES